MVRDRVAKKYLLGPTRGSKLPTQGVAVVPDFPSMTGFRPVYFGERPDGRVRCRAYIYIREAIVLFSFARP